MPSAAGNLKISHAGRQGNALQVLLVAADEARKADDERAIPERDRPWRAIHGNRMLPMW